jgi:hypothetical protein
MKKFLAFAAVAGMAALVSCGGADEAAKKAHDSMMADSIAKAVTADSMRMADSINKAAEEMAAKAKATADSMAAAAHQDSVDKKLIKTPKK